MIFAPPQRIGRQLHAKLKGWIRGRMVPQGTAISVGHLVNFQVLKLTLFGNFFLMLKILFLFLGPQNRRKRSIFLSMPRNSQVYQLALNVFYSDKRAPPCTTIPDLAMSLEW